MLAGVMLALMVGELLRMPPASSTKEQLNVRLSGEGRQLLEKLMDYYGLSQSGVIEMMLREKARSLNLVPTPGVTPVQADSRKK